MGKYVIGIDFGTLSARALLVDSSNGAVVAESEFSYPHAILKNEDFQNVTLKNTDAFQHPQDYLDALSFTVRDVLQEAGADSTDVVGLGFDFTSCTVLPVREDGTPLCFLEQYRNEPQAYVKLWKHQSAQRQADAITELAVKNGEMWLKRYGGKVSAEWFFPKLLETLENAPEVFANCCQYLEAADWLIWRITGQNVRGSCMAGYKAQWDSETGYPSNTFLGKLHPDMANAIGTKVCGEVKHTGTKAGTISEEGSHLTGLPVGTAVAVPVIDAHAALPAAGITDVGKLMLILGTSGCQILLSRQDVKPEGISGSVRDGIIPGFTALEAGQASVGDTFDWFIRNCIPERYARDAETRGENLFDYISERAAALGPGDSGLLAIDWFNGNRAPYADGQLSGLILGLNLRTKPEEIFRALVEATAFGTKAIVDTFEANGAQVREVYAAGGIAQKNAFMMQVYADVLGKEIRVVSAAQAAAKGSAVYACVAAGEFADVAQAAEVISDKWEKGYCPNRENGEVYRRLYEKYRELSEYFARSSVMKDIRKQ